MGFLEQPLPSEIHAGYGASKGIELNEGNLTKIGYTKEQLKRIKRELRKAHLGSS